jgi:hypothetical protein
MKHLVASITLVFFLLGVGSFLPAVQADTKSPLAGKMFADNTDKTDKKAKKSKLKKIFKAKKGAQDPCSDPKNLGAGPCGPAGPGPGGGTGPGPGGPGPQGGPSAK